MTIEIRQRLEGWVKLSDEADLRVEFEALIANRVDNFASDLTAAGLKLLTDYADALKDADAAWRKANPPKGR